MKAASPEFDCHATVAMPDFLIIDELAARRSRHLLAAGLEYAQLREILADLLTFEWQPMVVDHQLLAKEFVCLKYEAQGHAQVQPPRWMEGVAAFHSLHTASSFCLSMPALEPSACLDICQGAFGWHLDRRSWE